MLNIDERNENPMKIIGLIKDKIGKIFMLDDDITSLVMPKLDDDSFTFEQNWFGCEIEENIYDEEKARYLIGHCKDTPYFDETITDQRSMIMTEAYIRDFKTSYMNILLNINVVCHKNIIEFSKNDKKLWVEKGYAGNRVDMICMAIYNVLTSKDFINEFGIGKMNFPYNSPQLQSFKPNYNFYGRQMTFLIDEIYLSQLAGEYE